MMKPVRDKQAKMKKLIFIRHGKAEDQAAEISDFERSLTIRGKSQSRLMAQLLRSHEKEPRTDDYQPCLQGDRDSHDIRKGIRFKS